jgi:CBS-domain-containing membrane protein
MGIMTIGNCMKRQVVSVSASATVREAAQVVVEKRIGTLPVVDEKGVLIGVARISDVLRFFMPDFVALMDNIDFVRDFGAMENLRSKDMLEATRLTVRDIMQPPVAVEETCGLLRASATLAKHRVRDLPVVDKEGRLVGIASPVDIVTALLATWTTEESSP